jgi:hypothetical protein
VTLDHNLNDYVLHSRSRCDASVNFKLSKETFDPVKEVDELGLAGADIVGCLGVIGVKMLCTGTTREEKSDPCKGCIC